MSHTPPVPDANQSPYPLREPRHDGASASLPPVATADTPTLGDRARDLSDRAARLTDRVTDRARDLPLLAIGAAIGLGAAAIGGLVYGLTRDTDERRKPRRRKRG